MSDKKQVTIFVAGEHNSAKTSVIAIINQALKEAGFDTKLLSHAAADADCFAGIDMVLDQAEYISERVNISIEELAMPAPCLEGNVAPKGYVAIRHAGGMKIIPRGTSPAE